VTSDEWDCAMLQLPVTHDRSLVTSRSARPHPDTLHRLEELALGLDGGSDDDFGLLKFRQATGADVAHAGGDGADQVLALGQDLFSKPAGTSEAREQLLRLRGKSHQLHTAACLATGGKAVWTHVEIATLTMRLFSDAFLADYLRAAANSVCHTVGAYEIEGLGIQLFERIEGSLFTIIGLPLLPLLAELRARGVIDA